jgi:hypothetical protein
VGFKPALEAVNRVRMYPKLLQQAGQFEADVESLIARAKAAEADAITARAEGIAEGRDEIIGALLSLRTAPPILTAVTNYQGAVVLVGEYVDQQVPETGTRFHLVGSATGQVMGSVKVIHVDAKKRLAYLQCVETLVPAFWEHLVRKAEYELAAPAGVELTRYSIADAEGNYLAADAAIQVENAEVAR